MICGVKITCQNSTDPADATCEHQRRFCRGLLVVAFGFLDLCLLLGVFLLRLDFLVSTSHAVGLITK